MRNGEFPVDGAEFALCLTHDVDRPYKGIRSLYYALQERPAYHLRTALSSSNPYWQFDEIAALESELGVRSAFYFLNEQHLLYDRPVSDWLDPEQWVQHLGRYDVTGPDVAEVIADLDAGGWEVGLHGSFYTRNDPTRLREEKRTLERLLDHQITGGRQHYLRLSKPDTWRHYRDMGLGYDTSLGSSTEYGFANGYRPIRPFDDDFHVFPLTVMEQALPDPGSRFEAARDACEDLLVEAAENDAVMTALWHPRYFNEAEFPGYRRLYRWLVERALELGGWVGAPETLYESLVGDRPSARQRSSSGHRPR